MAAETPEIATETLEEISIEYIGNAFVLQFYRILHDTPERAYQFFNDSSTMTRPGPTGALMTVTTMDGIRDLILSLDCANCKAELLTADTQASHMNGVTVLVTGCLTGQDNVRKKFTESFFLAPQTSGYFVHNDVFRFIPEDSSPITDSVEVHCDDHAVAGPVTEAEPVTEVAPVQEIAQAQVTEISLEKHHVVLEEKLELATVAVVEQEPAVIERALPQPTVETTIVVQPIVEASSNGVQNAPKMSYAALLKNGKQGASTFSAHVPASRVKTTKPRAASKPVPPPGQQTQAGASESSVTNRNALCNGNASTNGHVAVKSHSIYIGHLPTNATPELVEKEFKKFGKIRKNGVQVRSSKGYVFGFVEYEDASGQEKAIEMGMILVGDKEVSIEEKRTTARADDYYPSGRGGYRNDGFRRGSYSNGRGYTKNDYGNQRNGEGHFRGNRNSNGHVNQNGGGRGAQQASTQK